MLTPEEIQAREFLVSLRGYDRDEVNSFLEEVAQQIGDLQSQLESLQAGQPLVQAPEGTLVPELVRSLQSSADPKPFFEDLGQTTQRIVEAAYESAAEIQRRARGRADRELADARSQAEKLVNEGQRRREVIEGLVEMLEERRAALAEDLRGVGRTVEQMLADFFAPRGEVAQLTEPDERWAPEEDDLAEAELAAAAEVSERAPVAQPVVGVTELAELEGESAASHTDDEIPQVSRGVRLA
ncbi:MAG: DivIVA domain-containing protein [Egibacteraceae bacterium]